MNIDNRSNIPDKKLRALINFVKPRGCNLCDIIVKNSKQPFSAEYHYPQYKNPYIIIRIGDRKWFPLSFNIQMARRRRTGYHGVYKYKDRYEALCFILAHEIFHNYTHQHAKLKHLMYQNLPKAEKIADNYGFVKLEKFRKLRKEGFLK